MTARKGSMVPAVETALRGLSQDARDGAAVELVRAYARQIDADPEALADLGPKLLAALGALGMTPHSRSVKGGGTGAPSIPDELAQLRERHAKR